MLEDEACRPAGPSTVSRIKLSRGGFPCGPAHLRGGVIGRLFHRLHHHHHHRQPLPSGLVLHASCLTAIGRARSSATDGGKSKIGRFERCHYRTHTPVTAPSTTLFSKLGTVRRRMTRTSRARQATQIIYHGGARATYTCSSRTRESRVVSLERWRERERVRERNKRVSQPPSSQFRSLHLTFALSPFLSHALSFLSFFHARTQHARLCMVASLLLLCCTHARAMPDSSLVGAYYSGPTTGLTCDLSPGNGRSIEMAGKEVRQQKARASKETAKKEKHSMLSLLSFSPTLTSISGLWYGRMRYSDIGVLRIEAQGSRHGRAWSVGAAGLGNPISSHPTQPISVAVRFLYEYRSYFPLLLAVIVVVIVVVVVVLLRRRT